MTFIEACDDAPRAEKRNVFISKIPAIEGDDDEEESSLSAMTSRRGDNTRESLRRHSKNGVLVCTRINSADGDYHRTGRVIISYPASASFAMIMAIGFAIFLRDRRRVTRAIDYESASGAFQMKDPR